jgi:hypothetical protein
MIGVLPTTLSVNEVDRQIRSDFRVALNLFEALKDESLSDLDRAYLTIRTIYIDEIPDEDFEEAVRRAYWFISGGDIPKSKPSPVPLIDWKHDESIIFPAVNKAAGQEVREVQYMHWWSFLGYMGEIGEGLYSTVINIRSKMANGKKLEKYEREFLNRNKDLIVLRTKEEQAAIEETEDFLKTLIGEGR